MRRIRYSRGFFPESTKELRARLFSSAEQGQEEAVEGDEQATGEEEQVGTSQQAASPWRLKEICPVVSSVKEYVVLLRASLKEVIAERVANGRRLSRRVLSVWNYQREQVYVDSS